MRVRRHSERGFLLVAVIVVVAMLAFSAYTLVEYATLEMETVDAQTRRVQMRLLAESGATMLEATAAASKDGPGMPDLHENPDWFAGYTVSQSDVDAALGVGEEQFLRLAVFSPSPTNDGPLANAAAELPVRFGVLREGGKIHLNIWMQRDPNRLRETLLTFPAATEELVDAVLDWLDLDDEPRPNGHETARDRFMDAVPCRNGPIDRIEELLSVRGMTPEILFGEDFNRNGRLDPNEDDGIERFPVDNGDGKLDAGWADYLTLWSREANVDHRGRPRININDADLTRLFVRIRDELGEPYARFIVACRLLGASDRQSKPLLASPAASNAKTGGEDAHFAFRSVVELVNAKASGEWQSMPVSLSSPLQSSETSFADDLALAMDRLTVSDAESFEGRIDLISAAPEVLAILPLAQSQREAIVRTRPTPVPTSTSNRGDSAGLSLAWLLTEKICTLDELILLEPLVTVSSPVIRFQTAGFQDGSRMAVRLETVMDLSLPRPRILTQTNLDRWGSAIPLIMLGQGSGERRIPAAAGAAR